MYYFTYEDLLDKIHNDLMITSETISLFTGLSQTTIDKPQDIRYPYGTQEYEAQSYLLFMLAQMYHNKPTEKYEQYVQDKIQLIMNHFHMSESAIISYLDISHRDYVAFMNNSHHLDHDMIMKITVGVLFFYISMIQNPYLYLGKGISEEK